MISKPHHHWKGLRICKTAKTETAEVKVVACCRPFSKADSDTFRCFLIYGKEQESQNKNQFLNHTIIGRVSQSEKLPSLNQLTLRLLTHVELFSKTESDTFRCFLIYGKEKESRKKMISKPHHHWKGYLIGKTAKPDPADVKVVDSCRTFFQKHSLILSDVFLIFEKDQECRKK